MAARPKKGGEGTPTTTDATLNALVRNTEALAHLNATMAAFTQDFAQNRQSAKEASHSVLAKLENLDRTIEELRLVTERGETARQTELKHIYDILGEERKDRRDVTSTQGKDEQKLLRDMVREEMGGRRSERNLIFQGAKAVWTAGGRYIVLAIAVLFAAGVMKITGMNLADLLGLAGK